MITICFLIKGQKGSVGILSIIAMILLGVVGAAYISLSSSEISSSVSYRNGVAAQFLAEAGARRAIVELNNNSSWTGASNVEMGAGVTAGKYTVLVIGTGNARTITSVGVVGNATRKVVLRVNLASSSNPYSYSIFSGANMNVEENAVVNGSVRSNTLINVDNNAHVTNDVVSHTSVNKGNNADIDGTITTNAPIMDIPAYNRSDFSNGSPISNVPHQGSANLTAGKYYREGDFIVGNGSTFTGEGTIYVTGNVIIENNATINGNFLIIAEGDIVVSNGSIVNKSILHSNKNITLSQNSTVTGSAVARGFINVQQQAKITYNQSVVTHFGLGGTPFSVISWGNQ